MYMCMKCVAKRSILIVVIANYRRKRYYILTSFVPHFVHIYASS